MFDTPIDCKALEAEIYEAFTMRPLAYLVNMNMRGTFTKEILQQVAIGMGRLEL